jgi:hypothetical protein
MFTPSQIGSEIASIAGVFEGVLPEVTQIAGASTNSTATVITAIEDLKEAATAFATADSAAEAGSLTDRVETDVNALISVLAGLPLPTAVSIPMRIAQILLPVIVAAVDLVFPQPARAPAAA